MPSNDITINGSKNLVWIVGDSKMPSLIKFLDKYGTRTKENTFKPSEE